MTTRLALLHCSAEERRDVRLSHALVYPACADRGGRVLNRRSNLSLTAGIATAYRPRRTAPADGRTDRAVRSRWLHAARLGFRRSHAALPRPELGHGDQQVLCDDASAMLYVQRSDGTRRTLLLVNPATSPAAPTLDAGTLDAAWTDLLISGAQDSATMALPPMSVRILGALTPSRAARPLSTALAEARTRISNLERRPADR